MTTPSTMASAPRRRSAWPILLLGVPAFVAIWSGWVGLGRLCGFGMVQPLPGIWDGLTLDTSITLPIGMEAYAAYALRVWLAGDCSPAATVFAKRSAFAALGVGSGGQVVYHLLTAAGVTAAPWPVTAAVAVLPVAVLGMGAALAHLVGQPYTAIATAHQPRYTQTNHMSDSSAPAPRKTVTTTARPAKASSSAASSSRRSSGAAGRQAPADTAARVAELLAADPHMTAAAIADRLNVSGRTARRHRAAVLAELEATGDAGATAAASTRTQTFTRTDDHTDNHHTGEKPNDEQDDETGEAA